MPIRTSPLPARWTAIGSASAGVVGGVVGLVLGLRTYPPTAWFAVFQVGMPLASVGAIAGLLGGTVAAGAVAHAGGDLAEAATPPRRVGPRWPDVVVARGALIVLYALWSMDWASRVDDLGRATFDDGPTRLLAAAALASLALSVTIAVTRWQWPRWLLLGTTFTTAVGAVVVALSRIAAANTNPTRQAIGVTATSYELGAAVGVGAALIVAAGALVGLLQSDGRPGGQRSGSRSPSSDLLR